MDLYAISIQKTVGCIVVGCIFLDLLMLTEYVASIIMVISPNPSVGASSRIRTSFFLLSVCTDKK